ncbi:aKG-HExxH-type peptide beta-hydroxylase [Streptomyces sp. NPDC093108]|uniref:aKG-HExxH-type peptide beta-hydroxylase n=1 Tax=Streptomyces sp. NPDC093108 TaxID=3366030 RepID=UPI003801B547
MLADKMHRAVQVVLSAAGFPESHSTVELMSRKHRHAPIILHPDVFHWYNRMLGAANQGKRAEVSAIHEELPRLVHTVIESNDRAERNVDTIGGAVDLINDESVISTSFDRCKSTTKLLPDDLRLSYVPTGEKAEEKLREGFSLVAEVWPEIYEDIQDSIQKIVLFDEPRTNTGGLLGFTDFKYHGAIFVRASLIENAKNAIEVADQLVHEAAHARLNTLFATRPLLRNDSGALYSSPLREDARPLIGVFQQMFVLSRLVEMYSRLAASGHDCSSERDESAKDLQEAVQVVREHAILTVDGSELVESIRV